MTTTKIFTDHAITDAGSGNVVVEGVLRVGIGAIVSFAGLTALWATACMISGIAKAGGVFELGRAWLTAITGV